ncbi:hypothetical protein M1D98_06255 [Bacillus sp. K7]
MKYGSVPVTSIRKLAMKNNIKHRGRDIKDVINELIENGHEKKLDYLQEQYTFAGTNLTLIKTEDDFPVSCRTSDDFLNKLIKEGHIRKEQIDHQWEPRLSPEIQICAIKKRDNDVYLKLVIEKTTTRKKGYTSIEEGYASYTTVVIHFNDQVIELRCAFTDRNKFAEHLIKLMGFGEPYDKWFSLTKTTKVEAVKISNMLSAGLVSTQINIPSSVGALRIIGKKQIDLRVDKTYSKLKEVIAEHANLPVDDIFDEVCEFTITDPVAEIEIPASFEIKLKKEGFKFKNTVPDIVYEQVIEAFIRVNYLDKEKTLENKKARV